MLNLATVIHLELHATLGLDELTYDVASEAQLWKGVQ